MEQWAINLNKYLTKGWDTLDKEMTHALRDEAWSHNVSSLYSEWCII